MISSVIAHQRVIKQVIILQSTVNATPIGLMVYKGDAEGC